MTRTDFSGVMRKGGGRALALGAAVSAALAVCLLALLAAQPAEAAFPGNNGKIIFWSNRSANPGLYTLSTDGTTQKLPGSGAGDSQAVWSPDGSRIAFQSTSTNKEISVMNAAGTGRRALTETGDRTEAEPTWSPDGSRIAFVANASDTDDTNDREIWMINSDGSGLTQLTDNAQGVDDNEPAWSPDGEQIAFVSNGRPDDRNRNIYVMDANPASSDAVNLTADYLPAGCDPFCYQPHDHSPSWSPDGTQITYSTIADVWKMDTDPATTDWTNLTDDIDQDRNDSDLDPAWAPDGSSIAYVHRGVPDYAIHVMDTAGLTHTSVGTTLGKNEKLDWQPIVPKLAVNNVKVNEKTATARFTVSLSVAGQQAVTVDHATTNGTAKAPADYAATAGTLTFLPGDTSATVAVPIKNDRRDERNEAFFVDLSNASTTVADASGKGTIVDNDR